MWALLALGNRGDQRGKGGVCVQHLSEGAKVRWMGADSCIEGASLHDFLVRIEMKKGGAERPKIGRCLLSGEGGMGTPKNRRVCHVFCLFYFIQVKDSKVPECLLSHETCIIHTSHVCISNIIDPARHIICMIEYSQAGI